MSTAQGLVVFALLALGLWGAYAAWTAWTARAAARPEAQIVGRWERTFPSGVRHVARFHPDGVAEFDGQAPDQDFMHHVRYKFVDDRTVVLMLSEVSARAVKDHYPDVREGRRVVNVGDEVARLTVRFPSPREMVITALGGEPETWRRTD